jgi:hypothetical protein
VEAKTKHHAHHVVNSHHHANHATHNKKHVRTKHALHHHATAIIHHPTQQAFNIQLQDFQDDSQNTQNLISSAFKLNQQHLHYIFGSADPRRHGMDCSGTINYLLRNSDLNNVPRRSDELYDWARNNGTLYPVNTNDFQSYQFAKLQPGDLLFWSGTYRTNHDYNITHVMLYLGKNAFGQPIMFGATDRRNNRFNSGIGIFNFNVAQNSAGHFVGYSCIPNLTCDANND